MGSTLANLYLAELCLDGAALETVLSLVNLRALAATTPLIDERPPWLSAAD
jgi:hypothetical protein